MASRLFSALFLRQVEDPDGLIAPMAPDEELLSDDYLSGPESPASASLDELRVPSAWRLTPHLFMLLAVAASGGLRS